MAIIHVMLFFFDIFRYIMYTDGYTKNDGFYGRFTGFIFPASRVIR